MCEMQKLQICKSKFLTQYSWENELGNNCPEPCSLTQTKITKINLESYDDNYALLRCRFHEKVKVTTAYYSYSGMSLIAEIGGHVGLFLGFSLFNIGFHLEKFYYSLNFK